MKYQNPWYLFNEYTHLSGVYTTTINGYFPQLYHFNDPDMKVYGIALTCQNYPWPYADGVEMSPRLLLFRLTTSGNLCIARPVDSLTAYSPHHNAYFLYEYERDNEACSTPFESIEFYFDRPYGLSDLSDSFLISYEWAYTYPVYWAWLNEDGGIHHDERIFTISSGECDDTCGHFARLTVTNHDTVFSGTDPIKMWGVIFPIVGLRCVAPSLRLVERGNGTATVSWTQAEAGVGYELSFGPYGIEPDSGTIVGTTDTSYTLTGLESGVREAVWVRKACRYDVYDSTVWSEWSLPLVFLTLGVDEVDGEAVRLQVRDGAVAVVGAADGEEVKLYDALGRQVAAARAAAGAETLLAAPAAGVYTVRIGSQPARRVVLTR